MPSTRSYVKGADTMPTGSRPNKTTGANAGVHRPNRPGASRPHFMKRQHTIVINTAILAAIFITGCSKPHRTTPPAPRDISISYLGLTNDADIGLAAMFSLTNSSYQQVYYSVSSLDFRTQSGWNPTDPGASRRFGDSIEPGKASMVWRIPAPKSRSVWRLTLSCVEEVKTRDGNWQGTGRKYSIVGPEITP